MLRRLAALSLASVVAFGSGGQAFAQLESRLVAAPSTSDYEPSARFAAVPPADIHAPRTLSLYNVNTGNLIIVTYRRDGRYLAPAIARLNDFLRDSRTSTKVLMEPRLFDILWHVRQRLRSNEPWRVLSAYRSPQTNAWLASVNRGVASGSYHMRGQAVDVMLPGRSAAQVRQTARELGLGGVGYYPSSGFVHIDTGPVRYW